MTNTPYRRRDLRLPAYDYASPGTYFVTICIQTRACILGDVVDGEVRRSIVGDMIETHLHLTEERHAGVQLDAYVIMPNHLHALFNFGWLADAEPGATPVDESKHGGLQLPSGDEDLRQAPELASLSRVMQWFKSATTNEYIRRVRSDGWTRFPGKLWQINYYEHVVRDQPDLDRIRTYIAGNPGKWESDAEYSPDCHGFTP